MIAPEKVGLAPTPAAPSQGALLTVEDLHTQFFTRMGVVRAVDGVSFALQRGETLGIVGESGSGKSVTALSIMRLIPESQGRIVRGRITFEGRDLLSLRPREMRQLRGNQISMIFQDPMTALNPLLSIGYQLVEPLKAHRGLGRREAERQAVALLAGVGIPTPEKRLRDYPHHFSGGMRQRVMIAMALACSPRLIIADEPTTALDVTIQAQILDLLRTLREKHETAVLLITHDLGVVAGLCDRVLVLYGGKVLETGTVHELYNTPKQPYTLGLLNSIPRPDRPRKEPLTPIPGSPPDLLHPPQGCPFAPRCALVHERCLREMPPLVPVSESITHAAACWVTNPASSTPPEERRA